MKREREFEIENYLAGEMSDTEKLDFEKRLQSDTELSSLFHLYQEINLSMQNDRKIEVERRELETTLQRLGKQYFEPETAGPGKVVKISRSRLYLRAMTVAASLILIIAAWFMFFNQPDARQQADAYVKNSLATLSQTMDGAKDSLQQGIAAYNNKDYATALNIFEAVQAAHPDNSDALQYAGIAHLATGNYDAAITKFNELSAKKQLFSNPGLFLKAVTLLQRNKPGDKDEARTILQQVVNENLENTAEAQKMLQNW